MVFILFLCFVSADEGDPGIGSGNITINVTEPPVICYDPEIYLDNTARGWNPKSSGKAIADYYGTLDAGGKYDCGSDHDRYFLPERQNYVFEGENLYYYVLIRDLNNVSDINSTWVSVNDTLEQACTEINFSSQCNISIDYSSFGITGFNATTDKTFFCTFTIKNETLRKGRMNVSISTQDKCNGTIVKSPQLDFINFNPSLSLTLTRFSTISFGTVTPGSIATSNSVYLKNSGDLGTILDIYIDSEDSFTDPNPTNNTICPTGNGIKYDRFSYYATKGSINSGMNDNSWYGVGKSNSTGLCKTNQDEFTNLTSHSGNIGDMCRVINWAREGSFLTQGAEMSITFRLNVPNPCSGHFTNGQFYFVGKII
jgi:hypothetical protein